MSVIKSFSVNNGDMFFIDHDSDYFTIIDCCCNDEIICDLEPLIKNKSNFLFISTHPDNDHIHGLTEFHKKIGIKNFYCVENKAIKTEETEDFKTYCKLRNSCNASYLSKDCRIGSKNGLSCLWPIVGNIYFRNELERAQRGEAFNNISPIITYRVGNIKVIWFGDIENTFLEKIKDQINWSMVDILFAPHHGRKSGKIPENVLKRLNPQVIVIGEASSENLNYYKGYNTITQNSAGSIVFECIGNQVNVYVDNEQYSVSFLYNDEILHDEDDYGYYIGYFSARRSHEY